MKLLREILSVSVLSSLFMSCSFDETSEVKHVKGETSARIHSIYWNELSLTQAQLLNPNSESSALVELTTDSSENALYSETALKFNELTSKIMSTVDEKTKGIPKPRLALVQDAKEVNAFVSSSIKCFIPESSKEKTDLEGIVYEKSAGTSFIGTAHCHSIEYVSAEKLNSVLDIVNGDLYSDQECTVDYSLDFICEDIKESIGFFAISGVANWVMINEETFTELKDSNKILAIVAHELAHYFLAHTSQYTFTPYLEDYEKRNEGAPVVYEKGYDIVRDLEKYERLEIVEKIKDAKLEPESFMLLSALTHEKDFSNICHSILLADELVEKYKDLYLYKDAVALGEKELLKFEKRSLICTRFTQTKDMSDMTLMNLKSNISMAGSGLYSSYSLGQEFEDSKSNFRNIRDIIDWFDNLVINKKQEVADLRAHAKAVKLGFYTNEQHADETAAEYLTLIGESPRDMSQLFLGLIEKDSLKEMCTDTVEKILNGQDLYLGISKWSSDHHSPCYRAVNIAREISFHNY